MVEAGVTFNKVKVQASDQDIIKPIAQAGQETVELKLIPKSLDLPAEQPQPPASILNTLSNIITPGFVDGFEAAGKSLIINIETTGLKPWEQRIVSIGVQDPLNTTEQPIVLIELDEASMILQLLDIIKSGGYTDVIGYGYAFDLRFVVLRAMKLGINCKQFVDLRIFDLMQSMAQVLAEFIYKGKQPPSLSDVCDFLFSYPKPFSDLDMIKFYKLGRLDKVIEFTSSQITRIMLLYHTFKNITETPA